MKNINMFFLLVFITNAVVFAIPQNIDDVNQRLDKVEDNFNKNWNMLDDKFDLKEKELQNTFDAEKNKMERTFDEISSRHSWGEMVTSFIGGIVLGTLITIFSLYFHFKNLIKTQMDTRFQKELGKNFERLLRQNKDLLNELIGQQEKIRKLKSETRLTIISLSEADGSKVEKLLKDGGFVGINHENTSGDIEKITTGVAIINDQNDSIKETDAIIGLIERIKAEKIFYFGPKRIPVEKTGKKIAFANLDAQLCGNLLKALENV